MAKIFLTGATGTLGSEVLKTVVEQKKDSLTILVRGCGYFDAMSRVNELGIKLGITEHDLQQSITVIVGDLQAPFFGLDASTYHKLTEEIEYVIHAAADLSLRSRIDEARLKIIVPIEHMITFALRCSQLKRFILVSTVGVGGLDYKNLPEKPVETTQFRNGYEQAKCESEQLIIRTISSRYPITIVRPSMIVGRTSSGWSLKPQIFSSICRLISGSLTDGILPDIRPFHLDSVPNDLVAQTLLAITRAETIPELQILHLASGPGKRISFLELERMVQIITSSTIERTYLSIEEFSNAIPLISRSYDDIEKRKLSFLPFFLNYFSFDQIFEVENTELFLRMQGLTHLRATDYLPASIQYIFNGDKVTAGKKSSRTVRSRRENLVS